ncbi:MAG: glycosyltransferase family 2 protein [Chloroflexi bacterium]|nr:glycosyltransferase family 2 protein [Chloroflexota bacterium]
MQPFLSVVIPAYNEADRIGSSLTAILDYLQAQSYTFELIVVDDGSRDQTIDVVKATPCAKEKIQIVSYTPNRGKGYAIRQGVLASHGEYVLFMDADLSTPVAEIANAFALSNNYDIVIGSRAISNSQIVVYQPLYRRIGAMIFNLLRDGLVGAGIRQFKDTQCGFKLFRGDIARQIFSQAHVTGFMFDVEILYLALKWHLQIAELPVEWANVPGSKLRLFSDTLRMFKDLALIRWSHRKSGQPAK